MQTFTPHQTPRKDGTIAHIIEEGARYHVIWWDSHGQHFSESRCEINKGQKRKHKRRTP